MVKNKKTRSFKLMYFIICIFLIASIGVFISIGFMVKYQDLEETYTMAEKATSFLKAECQKYDNYYRGNSARSMQDLLDKIEGFNKFISSDSMTSSDFMNEFIRTEHISGIIILNKDLSPVAQADLDNKNAFELWEKIIHKKNVKEILRYPKKTYIDHVTVENMSYDIAAAASTDGSRLIFCYEATQKPSTDPYELTLKTILKNNDFYKNPTLVITDGTKVLSTNSSIVDKLGTKQYKQLVSKIDWKEDQFTKFKYKDHTYYGLRRIYSNYYVYAVYDEKEIFINYTNLLAFAFTVYMIVGMIILAVQRHFDKISINNMEKQLGIINAISTSYSSTFLLHMEKLKLEAIHPSDRLKKIYAKHQSAYDFLFALCKNEVDKDYYSTVMHFLDMDTMVERLQNKKFLANEVKDKNGLWYSVLLIPQKYDENGKVQTVLVTTRDVTSIKQAEELSFKDKLTGLYNRNYMESRSKEFVRSDDFPVSLIMADCNYLKRTNDTLGHEYGDLLLQRIANTITETIPRDYVAMRVGGDEFLILCTQCSNEQAQQLVKEIKKRLIKRSDHKLTLSAAFGVATMENERISFEQAYKAADQAMYCDKKASRM